MKSSAESLGDISNTVNGSQSFQLFESPVTQIITDANNDRGIQRPA